MSEKILITPKVAVFCTRRGSYTVPKTHDFFDEIVEALRNKDTGEAYRLYSKKKKDNSRVEIKGIDLYFDGEKFDPIFAEAYQVSRAHGLSVEKLNLFFQNLKENPSPISVHAFSAFVAKARHPITDRGTFLAYKRVRSNWKDVHSNTFDNRPECVVEMDRSLVDIDQYETCSTGFHACSYDYLENFSGENVIVVEINPRDVVAVPPDYQRTKMRVASYRVLCTLPYFKQMLLSYEADALGNIPIFNTVAMKDWDVMSDVDLKDDMSPRTTVMTPEQWLAKRKEAK